MMAESPRSGWPARAVGVDLGRVISPEWTSACGLVGGLAKWIYEIGQMWTLGGSNSGVIMRL
jgi:hypothetical protein